MKIYKNLLIYLIVDKNISFTLKDILGFFECICTVSKTVLENFSDKQEE